MSDGELTTANETTGVEASPRVKEQTLAGRTVLITRARAQADEFAAALEAYGARVVVCPTIEIVAPESYAALDDALDNLFGYDWLIFTSANGVEYFLRRMEARGRDVSELDELRVCAIGAATAERLREARVHVDVVPEQFKAEGVFAALESFVGGRDGFRQQNFLIPRAAVARDYLPRALEEAGARVDVVAAYRTVRPRTTDRARVEALLVGGAVDCVTFTSSSTVINFAQLFDASDLSAILKGVRVACIGDITSETAARYGLHTDILPNEYTVPALARAIADFYANDAL
ncbi:MAG TPA: uroporphyrinogen-III synthase [Pyrinomonadaceae bacterium]|jgi:uroporphyrinogen III methyltransferase/synthase|nr:uroporphyrinogen-III synthase [Pyrinomonadaceae bacterium]